MKVLKALGIALLAVFGAQYCLAQAAGPAEGAEAPEEVIVMGRRELSRLRVRMLDAEKFAYEVFNSFNDEKRFEISCRMEQPLGTRLQRQLCQPAFEIEALRIHGRDYFENVRDMLNQFAAGASTPAENMPPVNVPAEFLIASQQADYRRKMREVAEQHPEFVEALKSYVEMRDQYQQAVGAAEE